MKRLVVIIALALPFVILTSTFALAQEPIEGEWAGGFRIARKWGFIKIQFKTSERGLSGIAEYAPENAIGLNLTQVDWQSPNLHFQLPRKAGTFVFDAQLREGGISGTVRLAGARAAFRLTRIAKIDAKVYGQYLGEYQLKSGGFISIYPRRGGGLVAHKSGQWIGLYFLSETSLLSELGETIAFVKNEEGEVTNLIVRQRGSSDKPANRVKLYTPEEVSFRNREVTLAGTLLIPNRPGPHPAIVMIHGSGPQNRSFGVITNLIARHGIAVLAYDKRGVGASTGDWRKSSFDDLAGDALAGVQFLQGHKEINSKQIGLVGASQGGGIAYRAATLSSEIAFVVSVCSGLEPELKQELYQVEWLLRHLIARQAEDKAGVIELVKSLAGPEIILPTEDKDQASALDFLKSVSEFSSTGEGWEGVVAAAEKLKDKPWFPFKPELPPKDQLWRMLNVSEKQAVLENVRCPLLALFGELDRIVMTEESVVRMEKTLKQSRHRDYTIKVFPKAGHNLMVAETGVLPIDLRRLRPAPVPGAYEMMIAWILKRVSVSG